MSDSVVTTGAYSFASASSMVRYLTTDVSTQGTWKGSYGADGYNIVGDAISYPNYVSVALTGYLQFGLTNLTNPAYLQKVESNLYPTGFTWINGNGNQFHCTVEL